MTSRVSILSWVIAALCAFLVMVSLTAGATGLDPDMRWGVFRLAPLAIGSTGLISIAMLQVIRLADRRLMSAGRRRPASETEAETDLRPHNEDIARDRLSFGGLESARRRRFTLIGPGISIVVVGIVYLGLVSVWHWTQWPSTTNYYGMLAESFTQGKTSLPIHPAAGLAQAKNPYRSWTALGGIVNLSYYQGQYYIYWGPAPAVFLAGLRLLGLPALGDEVVVFTAVSLLCLFAALTILRLRSVYFERLPIWLTVFGLATVAAIHPMLWFQNSPSVATAAIASGQSFLVAGVYFMVREFTGTRVKVVNYIAAGTFWGLALASRLITAAPVAVLFVGIALLSYRRAMTERARRRAVVTLIWLVVPLGTLLGIYGWYNAIRFGSPLETGFRFGFTEFDLSAELSKGTIFNSRYLPADSLYYLFAPARPISRFPYLRPVYADYPLFSLLLSRFDIPAEHRVEDAVGLVFAAPTLLFALVFARKWMYGQVPRHSAVDAQPIDGAEHPVIGQGALGGLILLSGLAAAAPIFTFFYTTTRYEMDFVPLLAIVSVLGMWRLFEDTRPFPIQGRLAVGAITMVVAGGSLISFLLALSGAASRFDDANSGLFSLLVKTLPHW